MYTKQHDSLSSDVLDQAWAGMTFAHLVLGMGNGQAYSQLMGLRMEIRKFNSQLLGLERGMNYQIPNCWDWECKLYSQHLGMGNCISFPENLGTDLGIQNVSWTLIDMLRLPSCANSCLLFSWNKLSLFKVNFSPVLIKCA